MAMLFWKFILLLFLISKSAQGEENASKEPPNGIFTEFLRKFLNYMELMPKHRVPKFLPVLISALESLECTYSSRLAWRLEKIRKGQVRSKAEAFREYMDENHEHASVFLKAMDDLMSRMQESRFGDYLDNLSEFILGYKLDVDKETKYIVTDVIPGTINKRLDHKDRKVLEKKLDNAIKEFKEEKDSSEY